MKQLLICLCMIFGCISANAQRIYIRIGTPCETEYYEYRHIHQCPPPPMRPPRYYYAPRPCDRPMHGPDRPHPMHRHR